MPSTNPSHLHPKTKPLARGRARAPQRLKRLTNTCLDTAYPEKHRGEQAFEDVRKSASLEMRHCILESREVHCSASSNCRLPLLDPSAVRGFTFSSPTKWDGLTCRLFKRLCSPAALIREITSSRPFSSVSSSLPPTPAFPSITDGEGRGKGRERHVSHFVLTDERKRLGISRVP